MPRLDQGTEGACVGFGMTHSLACPPDEDYSVTDEYARAVYNLARTLDSEPGEDYEGTSVLGGAKALRHLGRISEYRWCFSLEDVLWTISWKGPVVIGVNWYEGMWDTDALGLVAPTGSIVGGHCVCLHGVHVADQLVRFRNSWGEGWGRRGDGFFRFADLGGLLAAEGEACYPVK
jgi:hypothetical protein